MPLDSSRFISFVRSHDRFLITTHLNPDGDAIGSEIGLAEWLKSIGKTPVVVNHSPTPYNFEFLDPSHQIRQFENVKEEEINECDAVFVLDVNDPDRTKSLSSILTSGRQPVMVIDHHLEPKEFATDYQIDTDATSTGELICRLVLPAIDALGGVLNQTAATALYTAIITDTGSFRFPRTDSDILRISADLLDLGADPVQIYDEVYNTSPAARLLLMGESIHQMEFHHERQMAIQLITQDLLEKTGANQEDVDGFVQLPFQVGGVKLSVLLLELPGGWKISARSKGTVSAAALARRFGGNGHFHAAGARVHEPLDRHVIRERILFEADAILKEAGV